MRDDANSSGPHDPTLAGSNRAAALLLAMGSETAGRIIQRLSDEEVRMIVRSASQLGKITQETVARIVDEFDESLNKEADVVGNEDTALALVSGVLPEDAANRLQAHLRGEPAVDVWPKLPTLPVEAVAEHITQEHPQVAAYILTRLEAEFAAEVLTHVDDDLRSDILWRVLNAGTPSERAAKLVSGGLSSLINNTVDPAILNNGRARVAKILNQLESEHEQQALNAIAETNPDEASKIKKLLFRFGDLPRLSADTLTALFSSIPAENIIAALAGADRATTAAVLDSLSPRSRRMIEMELENSSKVPPESIKVAQNFIVDTVLNLAQDGEIELNSEGDSPDE